MDELNKPKVSVNAVIISVVLVAVIFGGGVYVYQSNKIKIDSTVDWKIFSNLHFSFQIKYPKDWENFANDSNVYSSEDSNQLFGPFQTKYPKDWENFANDSNVYSSEDSNQLFGPAAEAAKHKNDDPGTRWTYLNTEPVIMLSYGYYNDNSPRAALKSYLGTSDYNAGIVTDFTSTSGEKGVKFIGEEALQKQTSEIIAYSLLTRTPIISGQGKAVVFVSYSYSGTRDLSISQKLEEIAKTFKSTK